MNIPGSGRRLSFKLTSWFAALSFATIALVSVTVALIVSYFLTRENFDRDAVLTAHFVQSIAEAEGMQFGLGDKATIGDVLNDHFDAAKVGLSQDTVNVARSEFLQHFYDLPDEVLASIFTPERRIVWSTNPALVETVVAKNNDITAVLESRVVVASGRDDTSHAQGLLSLLGDPGVLFVKNYIPLPGRKGGVAAIVEIQKEPKGLIQSIRKENALVWCSTALGGLISYFALFWIVRRTSQLMAEQQRKLFESETLAVIGEMSSAVAHNIRSPLASIRSSAELGLDGDGDAVRRNLQDIITQTDRIGAWVRDLLVFSRPLADEMEPLVLDQLIRESVKRHAEPLRQANIDTDLHSVAPGLPAVRGSRSLFAQALHGVITNAIEAMPKGGRLTIRTEHVPASHEVAVIVSDTGTGMSVQELKLAFKPFYTTKRDGLGLGLSLASRIMERFGGSVGIASRPGAGTEVKLVFEVAG